MKFPWLFIRTLCLSWISKYTVMGVIWLYCGLPWNTTLYKSRLRPCSLVLRSLKDTSFLLWYLLSESWRFRLQLKPLLYIMVINITYFFSFITNNPCYATCRVVQMIEMAIVVCGYKCIDNAFGNGTMSCHRMLISVHVGSRISIIFLPALVLYPVKWYFGILKSRMFLAHSCF